jgi:hypothetical protein
VTNKELEALVGEKLSTKIVFATAGGRWFRRVGPDEWIETLRLDTTYDEDD